MRADTWLSLILVTLFTSVIGLVINVLIVLSKTEKKSLINRHKKKAATVTYMAKYSIITPIYNDANYLPVCIHSIACQEYPDIESILIDDGSTDGSLELCKSMTGANPRFKVVSSSHGGVSHARNIGLNLATGDYVIFLDSDDYLQADAIIIIDREIKDMECDLVLFDFIKEYSNGKNDLSSKKLPLKKVMDAEELSQTYLNDFIISNQVFSVLWDKAYKRVSIVSIRFD
jgi:glycosyltransferase involved in cell wall biosynthesis